MLGDLRRRGGSEQRERKSEDKTSNYLDQWHATRAFFWCGFKTRPEKQLFLFFGFCSETESQKNEEYTELSGVKCWVFQAFQPVQEGHPQHLGSEVLGKWRLSSGRRQWGPRDKREVSGWSWRHGGWAEESWRSCRGNLGRKAEAAVGTKAGEMQAPRACR